MESIFSNTSVSLRISLDKTYAELRSMMRKNYDIIEKRLRSLQALGENIESKILVSLIMAKLPKDVLIHLTYQKNDGDELSAATQTSVA